MNSLNIRKSDMVIVLSGEDVGKRAKVLNTYPKTGKLLIEGVNVCTKHRKPRKQTDPGGIMHQESPIYACKVMLLCPKCKEPTRVGHHTSTDGTRSRMCKKCGETI